MLIHNFHLTKCKVGVAFAKVEKKWKKKNN